jgi:hypothetical protein
VVEQYWCWKVPKQDLARQEPDEDGSLFVCVIANQHQLYETDEAHGHHGVLQILGGADRTHVEGCLQAISSLQDVQFSSVLAVEHLTGNLPLADLPWRVSAFHTRTNSPQLLLVMYKVHRVLLEVKAESSNTSGRWCPTDGMFVAIRIASQHAVESIDSHRNGVGTDLVIDFPTDIAQRKGHVTPLRRRIFLGRTVGTNEVRTLVRTKWKQPGGTHHSETVAIWKVRRTRSTEMDGAVNRLSLDSVADYAPIRD